MSLDKKKYNEAAEEDTKKIEKPTKEQEEFADEIRAIFQSIIDNEGFVDDETDCSDSDENDSDAEDGTDNETGEEKEKESSSDGNKIDSLNQEEANR